MDAGPFRINGKCAYDGLAERYATVIWRNLGVKKQLKASTPKPGGRIVKQCKVLERASAEANFVHAAPLAKLPRNRLNNTRDGLVKTTRNYARRPTSHNVVRDLAHKRAGVNRPRVGLRIDFKIVRVSSFASRHCF
jgi:hypothetical protein